MKKKKENRMLQLDCNDCKHEKDAYQGYYCKICIRNRNYTDFYAKKSEEEL